MDMSNDVAPWLSAIAASLALTVSGVTFAVSARRESARDRADIRVRMNVEAGSIFIKNFGPKTASGVSAVVFTKCDKKIRASSIQTLPDLASGAEQAIELSIPDNLVKVTLVLSWVQGTGRDVLKTFHWKRNQARFQGDGYPPALQIQRHGMTPRQDLRKIRWSVFLNWFKRRV